MALGIRPTLREVRNEFDSGELPSTESLRNFYTKVIGTSEGAESNGTNGRLSDFANTGQPSGVNTTAATSVGETGATLNGEGRFNVQTNSTRRQFRFQYAKDGDFINNGQTTNWQDDNSGGKTTLESVSQVVSGLDDGSDYDFFVQFRNGFGTTNGDIETFTTDAVVVCSAPDNVSAFLNTIDEDAVISWDDPGDGSPVTYQVRRRISSDGSSYGSWLTIETNASSPYTDPNYCTFSGDGYFIQYAVRSDCLSGNFSPWNQANTLGPVDCSGA